MDDIIGNVIGLVWLVSCLFGIEAAYWLIFGKFGKQQRRKNARGG